MIRGHLRFGIITEHRALQVWEHRCVEEIRRDGHEIRLVVEVESPPEQIGNPFYSFFCKRLRSAWLEAAPESSQMAQLPRLRASVRGEDSLICLNEAEITLLRTHEIDFLLSFVEWKLPAEIASEIPNGTWYFCGVQHSRRRPASAFWSLYNRSPSTVISLAKLGGPTERLQILRQGRIKSESYKTTFERGLEIAVQWPVHVCRELARPDPFFMAASGLSQDRSETPTGIQMLLFAARALFLRVEEKTGFFYFTKWSVGISNNPFDQVIRDQEPLFALPLLTPSDPFQCSADPFVLRHGGVLHLLYEEYDCRTLKGHIAYAVLHDGKIAAQGSAIEERHHLSYPCLIEHDGNVYCLPESSETSKLTLYRAIQFPNSWEQCATLLDEKVRDATLFLQNGRWWLFCSGGRADDNLLIYYADNLFGPWAPHAKNPVKIDIHSSRPAGPLLQLDGVVYRPSQDCAPTYGRRIALNRIDDLSTETFSEETVRFITPSSKSRFPDGLHTICPAEGITITDGRKNELLSLSQLFSRIAIRLKRKHEYA